MWAIFFCLLLFNKQSTIKEDQSFSLSKKSAGFTYTFSEDYDSIAAACCPLTKAASTVPPLAPS